MACQTIVASVVEQNFDVVVNDNDVTVTISLVAGTLTAGGSGTGDVIGPSSNTDLYVPQWNGSDTKTLSNGFPITALGKSLVVASTTAEARSILSITAATGDMIAPASNTDLYVPQWNGNNSKTLSDGFPISTLGKVIVNASTTTIARNALSLTTLCTFIINGSGSVPSTGAYSLSTVPRDTLLSSYSLSADKSGSAVIDVKIGGTSIVGTGNKPTLVSTSTVQATLSGWTSVSLTANQIMTFNLDSVSTCTYLELQLRGTQA